MMRYLFILISIIVSFPAVFGQKTYERDTIPTTGGNLVITFIGHASLLFNFQERNIYIDPVSQMADFSTFPKADAILITHEHGDHLDPDAIQKLSKPGTEIYLNELSKKRVPAGKVYANESFFIAAGVPVEVMPAYNIINKRGNGWPYHPKGDGNGYILAFAKTRVYVAGDTEQIPEMFKKFKDIQIAFLPISEPYTMSVFSAAEVARLLKPTIVYPYHMNQANPDQLTEFLKGSGIEVRIRSLK
jgi:L-ascorbate metabolism protein UlaG (beta-lactamase superfamily)